MPRQVFTAGEILTAASMNDLSDATVMVFDSSAARGSAIPTPAEGMVTYLKDTNQVSAYNGSAFAPIGTILQVLQTIKTDVFSMSSGGTGSYSAVTGLSQAITPSSTSSKILIIAQITHSLGNNGSAGHFKLSGGNTATYIADTVADKTMNVFGGFTSANAGLTMVSGSIIYLDSPATTSATTYQVEMGTGSSSTTGFINRDVGDQNRGASSITVMEVAG